MRIAVLLLSIFVSLVVAKEPFPCPGGKIPCLNLRACVDQKYTEQCNISLSLADVDIPSADIHCITNHVYCRDRNRCELEGAKCDTVCPSGSKKCPDQGMCVGSDQQCPFDNEDRCNNDICTNVRQHMKLCQMSGPVCNMIQHKDYLAVLPRFDVKFNCPLNHTVCPLIGGCIPIGTNCSNTAVNETTDPIYELCQHGSYFCRLLARCIPSNYSCGSHLVISKLIDNHYQHNTDILGKPCPEGHHYCDALMACFPSHINPCNNPSFDVRSFFNISCSRPGEVYCRKQWKCLPRTLCMEFHFYHEDKEDPTGWYKFCQNRNTLCNVVELSAFKCGNDGFNCSAKEKKHNRCLDEDSCQLGVQLGVCRVHKERLCNKHESKERRMEAYNKICGNGTKYCFFSGKCQTSCERIDSTVPVSDHSPWGERCRHAAWKYCPIFKTCIPPDISCSFKTLEIWKNAGKKIHELVGVSCSPEQKFCSLSMSCTAQWTDCRWYAGRDHTKSLGICPYPGQNFCFGNCSFTDCHGSPEIIEICDHRSWCNDAVRCLDHSETCDSASTIFSGVNLDDEIDAGCAVLDFQCTRAQESHLKCKEVCPIHQTEVVVETKESMSCTGHKCRDTCEDIKCYEVRKERLCEMELVNRCNEVMNMTDRSIAENEMRQWLQNHDLNCGDQYFCGFSGSCVANLTRDCNISSEYKPLVRKMPWGKECPRNMRYCPLLFSCINEAQKCSFSYLIDFLKANGARPANYPNGTSCKGGHTFCPIAMDCIPSDIPCDANVLHYVLAKTIGDPCPNLQFCKNTWRCVSNKEDCSVVTPMWDVFKYGLTCSTGFKWCESKLQCIPFKNNCPERFEFGPTDNAMGICQIKDLYCSRLYIAKKFCSNCESCKPGYRACRQHHRCVREELYEKECGCDYGSKRCHGSCIPEDAMCCGEGEKSCQNECISEFQDCPVREICNGVKCADLRHHPICKILDTDCPVARNMSERGTTYLKSKFDAHKCEKDDHAYCVYVDKCILKTESCTVDSFQEVAINADKCSYLSENHENSGEFYFCELFQTCVRSKEQCSFGALIKWLKELPGGRIKNLGNAGFNGYQCHEEHYFCPSEMQCNWRDSECHKNHFHRDCGQNSYFCQSTLSCMPHGFDCENVRDNFGSQLAIRCPNEHEWCGSQMKCLKREIPCEGSISLDIRSNIMDLCEIKDLFCYWQGKKFINCERCLSECSVGYYYCNVVSMCLKNGHPCTHRGPCSEKQYRCHDGCVDEGQPCCDFEMEEVCHSWCIKKGDKCEDTGGGHDGRGICFPEEGDSGCKEAIETYVEICSGAADVCPKAFQKSTPKEQVAVLADFFQNLRVCDYEKGERWCPFDMNCRMNSTGCDIQKASYQPKQRYYPWGGNCPEDDMYYCPFVGACIKPGQNCSLRLAVEWIQNKGKPFGVYCPPGEKICLLSMMCIKIDEVCAPLPLKFGPAHCSSKNQTFCPQNQRCVDNAYDCKSFNSTYFGIHDLQYAMGLKCQENEEFCENVLSCQPKGQCPDEKDLILPTKDDPTGLLTWCKLKDFFCIRSHVSLRQCYRSCTSECPFDHFWCTIEETCKRKGERCGTCPAMKREMNECRSIHHFAAESCYAADRMCPSMNQYIAMKDGSQAFSNEIQKVFQTLCEEGHYYCPLVIMCIPKDKSCTIDTEFPKTKLLPWGGSCSSGLIYCHLFKVCIPKTAKCSMRTLLDWFAMNDQQKYPSDFGIESCPVGTKFCPMSMRCVHYNFYEEHCSMKCVDGKCGSEMYLEGLLKRWNECKRRNEEICISSLDCVKNMSMCGPRNITDKLVYADVATGFRCRDNEKFCEATWTCIAASQKCPSPTSLQVNDDPTGWFAFCKTKVWSCKRAITASLNCIETCARPCNSDEFFCKVTRRCQKLDEYCNSPPLLTCSVGTEYCEVLEKCIERGSKCSLVSGTVDTKCYGMKMERNGVSLMDVINGIGTNTVETQWPIPEGKLMAVIDLGSFDLGKWFIDGVEMTNKLTEERAFIVGLDAKFSYEAKEPNFDLLQVTVALIDQNSVNALRIFKNIKEHAQANGPDSVQYKKLVLVYAPLIKPKFKAIKSSEHIMLEDERCASFKISDKFECNKDDRDVDKGLDSCEFHKYVIDQLQEIVENNQEKKCGIVSLVSSMVNQQRGKWYLKREGDDEFRDFEDRDFTFKDDMPQEQLTILGMNDEVCYSPAKDETGMFKFTIMPIMLLKNRDIIYGEEKIDFTLLINGTDDSPLIKKFVKLPAIPYDVDITKYNGFTVEEIIAANVYKGYNLIKNVDEGKELGICVLEVISSPLGEWHYKIAGKVSSPFPESFRKRLLTKDLIPTEAVCLKPSDRLIFKLVKDVSFDEKKSMRQTGIKLKSWSISEKSESMHGEVQDKLFNRKFVSFESASAFQLRDGCDNNPGSGKRFDACNVCGGIGKSCLGCDGKPNSGAKYDRCKVCVGGTTNRQENFLRDCADRCNGTFVYKQCGGKQICVPSDKDLSEFQDCHGDCNGLALTNNCGYCVGGNTGTDNNEGLDKCGVCGGDDTSCRDCKGVMNGNHDFDVCGECLAKDDPNFDKGCGLKLGSIEPTSGSSDESTKISIKMTKIDRGEYTATCKCGSSAAKPAIFSADGVSLTTECAPSSAAGEVDIVCVFVADTNAQTSVTAVGKFTYISVSVASVTGFSPAEFSDTDNVNVTVTGTGFLDTKCACVGPDRKIVTGQFISSTEIRCFYNKVRFTQNENLIVAFYINGKIKVITASKKLKIDAKMPTVKSHAEWITDQVVFSIEFDRSVEMLEKKQDCSNIFTNVTSLGVGPKCMIVKGNYLAVKLGRNSTILPADVLTVNLKSFRPWKAVETVYSANTAQVTMKALSKPLIPVGRMLGRQAFGTCEDIEFKAEVLEGDGRRTIDFHWQVEMLESGNASASELSNLQNLNDTLTVLPKAQDFVRFSASAIDFNRKYKIIVTMTNFMGRQVVVEEEFFKSLDELPTILLPSHRSVIASEVLKIEAKSKRSPCISETAGSLELVYLWDIEGIVFAQPKRERLLVLEPGIIEGGRIYTVKCIVCMAELCAEKSMKISVIRSPLVPIIKGGPIMKVGINSLLVLDASKSFDPDNEDIDATYSWEILAEDGSPLYVRNANGGYDVVSVFDNVTVQLDVKNYFKVGKRYVCNLYYRKGSREEQDMLLLMVESNDPVEVFFETDTNVYSDISNAINVCAFVKNIKYPEDTVTYKWSVISDEEGFEALDLSSQNAYSEMNGEFRRFKAICLVLMPETLNGGSKYKFQLEIDNGKVVTQAVKEILTNSQPSVGELILNPPTGTALETKFSFEAVRWSGSSELQYRFGYKYKDERGRIKRESLSYEGEGVVEDFLLPAVEDLRLFCVAYDIYGGKAYHEVTVNLTIKELTVNDVSEMNTTVKELQGAGDIVKIESLVSALSMNVAKEVLSAAKEIFRSVLNDVVEQLRLGNFGSTDNRRSAVNILMKTTTGIVKEDPAKSLEVVSVLKSDVGSLPQSARRKRRAVSDDANVVTPKTVEDVEPYLTTFDNTINPSTYDQTSLQSKQSYLESVKALGVSLCMKIVFGSTAQTAVSNLVTIQATKHTLSDANSTMVTLVNTANSDSLSYSSDIVFSESVKDSYSVWNCEGTNLCSGVCLTAAQFSQDTISTMLVNGRASDIVTFNLWNPNIYTELTAASNHSFVVNLKLNKDLNSTKEYPVCKMWNGTVWTTVDITTAYETLTNGSVIKCGTKGSGYVAVFTEELIITTVPPTTTESPSTSPTTTPKPKLFRLIFPGTCSDHFNDSTKAAFEEHLKGETAKLLDLPESNLKNFGVSCGSVIVDFELDTSNALNPDQFHQDISSKIDNLIATNSFNVTSLNGQVLSVSSSVDPSPPTAEKKEDDSDVGLIVGIVVGVVLLLLIIIAIIVFVKCSKRETGRKQISAMDDYGNNNSKKDTTGYKNPVFESDKPKYPLTEVPPNHYPGMPLENGQYEQVKQASPTDNSPPGYIVPNNYNNMAQVSE